MKKPGSWSHTFWVMKDETLVKKFCQANSGIPTSRRRKESTTTQVITKLSALHANAINHVLPQKLPVADLHSEVCEKKSIMFNVSEPIRLAVRKIS